MENRSHWVDYAKAIGIVLVVYGHVLKGLHSAGIKMPEAFYELSYSIVYTFHMPLFFFLSGLFFYSSFSKRGAKKLVFSKIDTIVYPYIVWSVFQGLIEAFLSDYTNGNVAYSDVFSLLWAPRAQFWFLYALFLIFVLSSAIFSLVSKRFAVLVTALAALAYIASSALPDFFIIGFLSRNFVFFLLGILFTEYCKAEQFSSLYYVSGLTLLFLCGQYVFHFPLGLYYENKGVASLCLALVSILTVVSISSFLSVRHYRFFVFIGTSSMAIYLMHILAGSGVRVILKSLMGIDSFAVHIVAGTLLGVLAPLLAVFIINKFNIPYVFSAPVSRWVSGLLGKTTART